MRNIIAKYSANINFINESLNKFNTRFVFVEIYKQYYILKNYLLFKELLNFYHIIKGCILKNGSIGIINNEETLSTNCEVLQKNPYIRLQNKWVSGALTNRKAVVFRKMPLFFVLFSCTFELDIVQELNTIQRPFYTALSFFKSNENYIYMFPVSTRNIQFHIIVLFFLTNYIKRCFFCKKIIFYKKFLKIICRRKKKKNLMVFYLSFFKSLKNKSLKNKSLKNKSLKNKSLKNKSLKNKSLKNKSLKNKSLKNNIVYK